MMLPKSDARLVTNNAMAIHNVRDPLKLCNIMSLSPYLRVFLLIN